MLQKYGTGSKRMNKKLVAMILCIFSQSAADVRYLRAESIILRCLYFLFLFSCKKEGWQKRTYWACEGRSSVVWQRCFVGECWSWRDAESHPLHKPLTLRAPPMQGSEGAMRIEVGFVGSRWCPEFSVPFCGKFKILCEMLLLQVISLCFWSIIQFLVPIESLPKLSAMR